MQNAVTSWWQVPSVFLIRIIFLWVRTFKSMERNSWSKDSFYEYMYLVSILWRMDTRLFISYVKLTVKALMPWLYLFLCMCTWFRLLGLDYCILEGKTLFVIKKKKQTSNLCSLAFQEQPNSENLSYKIRIQEA